MAGFDSQLTAVTGGVLVDPFASGNSNVGTSFSIEQVDGAKPIRVLLRGRAMPYQEVGWDVEQHSKITWYPGNPVATQQILGPRESSGFSIKGMWKDRFLKGTVVKNGDPNAITSAAEAIQLFEQLTRSGKRVRVQWAQEVRLGIIKKFEPVAIRVQDWSWTIEFEWSARDDEEAPKAATEAPAPSGSDLLKRLNALENTLALVPDMAQAFEASLVSTIASIRDGIAKVVDLLQVVETIVNTPAAVIGALKAAVASLGRQIQDYVRRIAGPRSSATDHQTATQATGSFSSPLRAGPGGATPASSAITQQLQFEIWRRTTAQQALALLFQLQRLTDDVIGRVRPNTTRIVTVKQGQTLYSLAAQFYGSSDFANFLALTNRLTTALVPAGFRLRVPDRPTGAVASIEPVTSSQPPVGDGRCC